MFKNYLESYRGLSKHVWLLSFIMLVNRSGTMVIPFLSIYMTQDLGLSLQEAGLVLMFFGVGSFIGNYLGGILSDKFGYFIVQFLTMFFTGVMFLIMEHVTTFYGLCTIVLITTIISDSFRPANMAAVADKSTPENRTRSVSLLRLAFNLGWAVAPAVGGLAIAYFGYAWLFRLDGITCILAALMIWFLLEPEKAKDTDLSDSQANKENESTKTKVPNYFILFVLSNTIMMICFLQIVSTLPVYYRSELLITEDIIGLLMAFNGLIIAAIEMPLVFKYEKRYPPLKLVYVGSLMIGISYFIFNFGENIYIAIIGVLIVSIGEIFQMPFANSWVMDVAPENKIGKYMAYYSMSFSMAFIISPILGMSVADNFGYLAMWDLMLILSILAIIGYYFTDKMYKKANNLR